ncbi:MAG: septum formation protein Maf [Ignavibacteriales bacterium]|nr:septum formation protein Maf [Ignavibacteriales bacterium]
MIIKKQLILASRSPRRQILLKQLGLKFDVVESGVDEDIDHIQIPIEHVTILSQQKAIAVGKQVENGFVIGADTIVVLDGRILGKPEDANDAIKMLGLLSDRIHKVFTGFTILDRPSNKIYSDYEMTDVTFRKIFDDEIKEYVRSGSPLDKAGAYGIQDDYGAVFVKKIDGCFYNVVGFPLTKFYLAIEKFQTELGLL